MFISTMFISTIVLFAKLMVDVAASTIHSILPVRTQDIARKHTCKHFPSLRYPRLIKPNQPFSCFPAFWNCTADSHVIVLFLIPYYAVTDTHTIYFCVSLQKRLQTPSQVRDTIHNRLYNQDSASLLMSSFFVLTYGLWNEYVYEDDMSKTTIKIDERTIDWSVCLSVCRIVLWSVRRLLRRTVGQSVGLSLIHASVGCSAGSIDR